ncbi:hypothetical protein A4G99_18755 [Haladaptatus sp. R4]|uniref:sulfatase-like hydrolase/transferase n=1 Tax=Haladaptatus sp. R4 TaxID=1679489 RepID=UPI0007B4D08A|nr:sulfatase-like hydrolase/transferase [Haladaptatus sp. R4]KZN22760.1 hypothetical protein A4G99_18755 [Haladaptatus sp. R4]
MAANAPPASRARNVLLICLDTVRADFFAEYAKRLQRLSDVTFTGCRAASSWTVPSHASMFTGELPSKHGVHTYNRRFDTIDRDETFLSELDGYTTFGVSANAFVSPTYGFDSWFDEFAAVEPKHRYPEATSLNEVGQETDGTEKYTEFLRAAMADDHPIESLKNTAYGVLHQTTKTGPVPKLVDNGGSAVLDATKRRANDADEPFFGFCNLMDAHTPLQPCRVYDSELLRGVPNSWTSEQYGVWELMNGKDEHEDYWRVRRQVYGATIEYIDRLLSTFVHEVLDSSRRETTIIVTADHGENHAEEADDYLANHKSSLSEGLLHVPLCIINPPAGYEPEETGYVSQLELGRLVTGLANGETPDVSHDEIPAELVGLSAGPEPPENREYWDRMMRCVYEEGEKTVWDSLGTRTEYELDPSRLSWQRKVESDEGGADGPDDESPFFADAIAEAKATAQNEDSNESSDEIDASTESRLRELGYL